MREDGSWSVLPILLVVAILAAVRRQRQDADHHHVAIDTGALRPRHNSTSADADDTACHHPEPARNQALRP
jgi:hypothetical protein